MNLNEIISERNLSWKNNKEIPAWVDIESVGLDQFYTYKNVAKTLFDELKTYINNDGIDIKDCVFIEPSTGEGAFYDLLPIDNRIGIDIFPMCDGVIKQDFLSWTLPEQFSNKKIVFIGNPPFGYRAWLALVFMNHAAKYADYIGFILPMAFQSEGKGSPKHRVKGMKLEYYRGLENNCFYLPNGKLCKINALWQIWKKGENEIIKLNKCSDFIELFTVDERKERLCGQEKMKIADYFLQRTFYSVPPKLVKNFSQVKYVCGYGLIIKKERAKVVSILQNTDWNKYSNLAAHNCRHISMYHIEKALIEGGITHA